MNMKFYVIAILLALSMGSARSQYLNQVCVNYLEPLFTGNCASDYAVIAATAVEYAWCLRNPADFKQMKISSQDIICNCTECHTIKGNGCMGGQYLKALEYLKTGKGKGGSYPEAVPFDKDKSFDTITNGPKNYHDCLSYFRKPCDPDQETTCDLKAFNPATDCGKVICDRKPAITVANASITGLLKQYSVKKGKADMESSLSTNKPLISTMEIFEDMEFFLGSDDVYVHTTGQSLGVVNVLIVGLKSYNGVDYWTVLVPWDKRYDQKVKMNTLRVIRGINHCNIENEAYEITVTDN